MWSVTKLWTQSWTKEGSIQHHLLHVLGAKEDNTATLLKVQWPLVTAVPELCHLYNKMQKATLGQGPEPVVHRNTLKLSIGRW